MVKLKWRGKSRNTGKRQTLQTETLVDAPDAWEYLLALLETGPIELISIETTKTN